MCSRWKGPGKKVGGVSHHSLYYDCTGGGGGGEWNLGVRAIASIHSFTGMQFPCLLLLYSIAGNFQGVKKFSRFSWIGLNPRKFNHVKLYGCDYICVTDV